MAKRILVWTFAFVALCAYAGTAIREDSKAPALTVRTGVVLEASPTKVLLSATNAGKQDVFTSEVRTNRNRLVFVNPQGKEVEDFVWKRYPRGEGIVTIGPGQTRTWEVEIGKAMQRRRLTQQGWYGLYWSVEGAKSNTLLFYRPEPPGPPEVPKTVQ